ncbi:hypothetical protein [Rhodopirellula sp. P2]|uniref:hypothetical protein n=1 Tax=Rhodopirellula sp. P2 TaxID=2127060 RepID=UPI0023685866|nr:hypothetical protein [Rhodopirellula sp. P2]WDQ16391.1 hypothetical protein PSR62_22610 [Rhodopirellula sp. P2]
MTSPLESARQIAAERNAAKAAAESEALAKARQMAVSLATEADGQPTAQDIIEVTDTLGADVDWFFECVERCKARIQDCENQAKLPALREQADELTKTIERLKPKAKAAEDAATAKVESMRSKTGVPTMRFFREDVTAEDFAELRSLINRKSEIGHTIWLAQRDLARVHKEQSRCKKIDAANIDPKHPSPHNFVMPPWTREQIEAAAAAEAKEKAEARARDPFAVRDGESFLSV